MASTTAESRAKILCQWNAFGSPGGLGCCPFSGGGSVFSYLLFNVFLIVCEDSVFAFVLLCLTVCPFYFCNHLEEEENAELVALLLLSYQCLVNVNALRLFLMVPWDGPVCSM